MKVNLMGRLALYMAACRNHEGSGPITSEAISEATGINATQVRRDLSGIVGKQGRRGIGYQATSLGGVLLRLLLDHADELSDEARLARTRAKMLTEAANVVGYVE